MNMREALELAAEIESTPGYLVIAVGRFMIISELLDAQNESRIDQVEWRVSVISYFRSTNTTPQALRSRSDWHELLGIDVAEKRMDKAPSTKTAAKRRDEMHMRQPTLF